jgi:hypothetical protein
MGRAHIVVTNELLERIKAEASINHRVSVVSDVPFCDDTRYALVSTPLLRDGYHGVQDIIIEDDGTIFFRADCDV